MMVREGGCVCPGRPGDAEVTSGTSGIKCIVALITYILPPSLSALNNNRGYPGRPGRAPPWALGHAPLVCLGHKRRTETMLGAYSID